MILWGKWAFALSLMFAFPSFSISQDFNSKITLNVDAFEVDSAQDKFEVLNEEMNLLQSYLERLYMHIEFQTSLNSKKATDLEDVAAMLKEMMQAYSGESEKFFQLLLNHYLTDYSLDELRQLSEFYQTDLGKKKRASEDYLYEQLILARKELEEIKKNFTEGKKGGKKKKKKRK